MTTQQPNNHSTQENPVGRFMVASGAVIEHAPTGKILLIQRSAHLDWRPNQWEILYGRIDQFEDTETGLRREVSEEIGVEDLEIVDVLSVWHIFRGSEKLAENELIGITYHCRTNQLEPQLSHEHQAFKWLEPTEALQLVSIDGIKRDIRKFMEKNHSNHQ
jgi:8-oxo-dGTP pyrophosphatase MutT (NUDIX family)